MDKNENWSCGFNLLRRIYIELQFMLGVEGYVLFSDRGWGAAKTDRRDERKKKIPKAILHYCLISDFDTDTKTTEQMVFLVMCEFKQHEFKSTSLSENYNTSKTAQVRSTHCR